MENNTAIQCFKSKSIHEYKPVLEKLVDDFGYSYYHAILAWCGIIDNSTPDNFWEVWLVQFNGQVIGICGLYATEPHHTKELWLGWFGIVPEHRNKGIGAAVLDFLKKKCKYFHCTTLYSYVDKNGKPLPFYHRNGFSTQGTVADYIADKPHLLKNFEDHFSDKADFVISCPIEKNPPRQYTKHVVGEMVELVQRCLICGEVISDYRNAWYPAGQDAPTGWAPGELFVSSGNPIMFATSISDEEMQVAVDCQSS